MATTTASQAGKLLKKMDDEMQAARLYRGPAAGAAAVPMSVPDAAGVELHEPAISWERRVEQELNFLQGTVQGYKDLAHAHAQFAQRLSEKHDILVLAVDNLGRENELLAGTVDNLGRKNEMLAGTLATLALELKVLKTSGCSPQPPSIKDTAAVVEAAQPVDGSTSVEQDAPRVADPEAEPNVSDADASPIASSRALDANPTDGIRSSLPSRDPRWALEFKSRARISFNPTDFSAALSKFETNKRLRPRKTRRTCRSNRACGASPSSSASK